MTDLQVALTASPDRKIAADVMLAQRHSGLMTAMVLMPGFVLAGCAAAWGLAALTGATFRLTPPVAASSAAAMVFILYQNIAYRRARRDLAGSALRNTPMTATFSSEGLILRTGPIPLAGATTLRWHDGTIVQFSALDGLLIPDADLPSDLSPEALAARIAGWKAQ